jgi:hypothetical protein
MISQRNQCVYSASYIFSCPPLSSPTVYVQSFFFSLISAFERDWGVDYDFMMMMEGRWMDEWIQHSNTAFRIEYAISRESRGCFYAIKMEAVNEWECGRKGT